MTITLDSTLIVGLGNLISTPKDISELVREIFGELSKIKHIDPNDDEKNHLEAKRLSLLLNERINSIEINGELEAIYAPFDIEEVLKASLHQPRYLICSKRYDEIARTSEILFTPTEILGFILPNYELIREIPQKEFFYYKNLIPRGIICKGWKLAGETYILRRKEND